MIYENNENDNYIIDNQFIPCVNWFKMSIDQTYINISEDESWKKMSFGNRTIISGGNGLINLTVPLENGRNQKCAFRDVKITQNENWQIRHWRTIVSCYNRSPFFEFYEQGLQSLYSKKQLFLYDLNISFIDLIFTYLSDKKEIRVVNENKYEHLSSKDYFMTPKNFKDITHPITYHQLFMDRLGFIPNLSILDMLFMEGPNCKRLLNNSK